MTIIVVKFWIVKIIKFGKIIGKNILYFFINTFILIPYNYLNLVEE